MDISVFLDGIERQIQEAREKIIKENQELFVSLVMSKLKKGDVLFVANGTSLLNRQGKDNTNSEPLKRVCDTINRGVWEIGFDFEYKTRI